MGQELRFRSQFRVEPTAPDGLENGLSRYQSTMDTPVGEAHSVAMDSRQGAPKRLLVAVVDDDESVRESLPDLLREFGFDVSAFSSAVEFLASGSLSQTKCLILDIAMPEMSGLDLQRELTRRRETVPVIFITGQKDDDSREQALKQGAVQVLYKPFSDTALLEALNEAVAAK